MNAMPATTPRSEDHIIAKIIKLKFGDSEYEVPVLRINKARQWREKFVAATVDIAGKIGAKAENSEAFTNGLAFIFLQFPEKISELVFSYAEGLDKQKIEDEATDSEIAVAFGKVLQAAFPFGGELRMITQTLGVISSFPQSERSTK